MKKINKLKLQQGLADLQIIEQQSDIKLFSDIRKLKTGTFQYHEITKQPPHSIKPYKSQNIKPLEYWQEPTNPVKDYATTYQITKRFEQEEAEEISAIQNTQKSFLDKQNIMLQDDIVKKLQNKDDYIIQKILTKNNITKRGGGIFRKRKKPKMQLKQSIKKFKIKNLCNKFIQKLRRNNIYGVPVNFSGFKSEEQQTIFEREGFQVNKHFDNLLSFFSIIQILSLFFSYTLTLVFPEVASYSFISDIQTISIIFYLLEIIYNSVTVKSSAGKKLSTFGEILKYYSKSNMVIDIVSLLILVIDNYSSLQAMLYLRLFIIAKLPQCLEKLQKLEVYFIKNYYHEQYWSLAKVLIFNFGFAHILAILLTALAQTNQPITWHTVLGIKDVQWFEQYVWAYYWGCNIMLTVGFGDISASNYKEAMALILIEIVSVMCLAYNINSVGTLISNIRSQDIEKFKNSKTLKQLSDKYNLPNDLEWKISNYIEQSVNIKKNFNLAEEKSFLENLPADLKKEYLKESNKTIFENLTFFKDLMEKTLYSLAQRIELNICHPDQILKKIEDNFNLYILRSGEVGLTSKKRGCEYNNVVIDSKRVTGSEKPFLLGLQFLTRKKNNYEIKSKQYSIIYFLEYDKLLQTLKDSEMDYHHFCSLRDKSETNPDEYQVFDCEFCKKKHSKFTCSKLHFIPIKQHVIHKQLQLYKKGKNRRNCQLREKTLMLNSLLNFNSMNATEQTKKNITKPSLSSNPLVSELKNISNLKLENNQIQLFDKMALDILQYAGQAIKGQFLSIKKQQNFEDQIWTIRSDSLKNYRYYFLDSNPINLEANHIIYCEKKKNLKQIEDYSNLQQLKAQTILKQFSTQIKFQTSRKNLSHSSLTNKTLMNL